jgi:ABC-type multidrug transport system ATPase subunit
MYCVETNNLTHRFAAGQPVLDKIQLQVPQGSVYGFLGPNGAGKTTTLRLLLGLLKKQEGDISIFGKPFSSNRISSLQRIGSMIESPSLYGHLTARENLRLLQKIFGCSLSRIDAVLQTVGMGHTGNKKVSQFSLGMKQRLSIAVALLHEPELLILDEPTNGLDPYGIIEIRDLLKHLNEEKGVTIIISSHLLSEIEKSVTHVGIISKGSMVFQDTLETLTNKQTTASKTILHTSNIQGSQHVLRQHGLEGNVEGGKMILPVLSREVAAKVTRELVNHRIDVYELCTVRKSLETIFMDLINQQ